MAGITTRRTHLARPVAAGVLSATLAILLTAALAGAHPSFDVATVPADSNQRITLSGPIEGAEDVRNIEIGLHMPPGFEGITCVPVHGWICEVDDVNPDDVVIRWTLVGGLSRPESFVAVVRTPPSLGVRAFVVDQSRSDGSVLRWDDPPAGLHPAPRLQVTEAGSQPQPNDAPPPSHDPTTTTVAPDPTAPATTAPPSASPLPAPTTPAPTSSPTTTGPAPSTLGGGEVPTTVAEAPEVGDLEAVPPSELSLGPDDEEDEQTTQTPVGIAVGLAAGLGALTTWLLLRRANERP